ncbi:hypothetical protein [Natranaeroarchaeum aerophilus]|uniref:Uncharacterized protein n=1 Tax=Natranaeroarchaeum aerophilus TaxID=2917711 RepID=A0AAE3K3H0_9EURY|nr:hypothetical protein [Natranaeroarchaeum aerophilus]MCL9812622.1 hypothetical protein [Natranaeroarchaeum aerophilus]
MTASANSITSRYRILAPWQFAARAVLLGLFTGGALGASISPELGVAGGLFVTTVVYFGLFFLARRLRATTSATSRRAINPVVAADGGQSNDRD